MLLAQATWATATTSAVPLAIAPVLRAGTLFAGPGRASPAKTRTQHVVSRCSGHTVPGLNASLSANQREVDRPFPRGFAAWSVPQPLQVSARAYHLTAFVLLSKRVGLSVKKNAGNCPVVVALSRTRSGPEMNRSRTIRMFASSPSSCSPGWETNRPPCRVSHSLRNPVLPAAGPPPCMTSADCTEDGEVCCPVKLVCEVPDTTDPLACGESGASMSLVVVFSYYFEASLCFRCLNYLVGDGVKRVNHHVRSEVRDLAVRNEYVAAIDCVSEHRPHVRTMACSWSLRLLHVTNTMNASLLARLGTRVHSACRHR